MKFTLLLTVALCLDFFARSVAEAGEPVAVGSRRELFVDDHLIAALKDARRQLHHPVPREIAIVHGASGRRSAILRFRMAKYPFVRSSSSSHFSGSRRSSRICSGRSISL